MGNRPQLILMLAGVYCSLGATYETTNFEVHAPDARIARQVGRVAEKCRKEIALKWLGRKMPRWQKRCPLEVSIRLEGSGGATTFQFDHGEVLSQSMVVEGTLERILASVVPHEVTHTVLAHYFREPVPRWADEGAACLSEDHQ